MNALQPFLLLLFSLPFTHSVQPRRFLHQPLFPASSPPPSTSGVPDSSDQAFFPEPPHGASAQTQPLPPPPSSSSANNGSSASIPTATQPTKPAKKYAIAISVGIVTLGMLSALAFYIYKHKAKHPAAKLTLSASAAVNSRPRSFLEDSRVEGFDQRSDDTIVHNHKLNSVKKPDRYRPSPDLQPLPPLTRTLVAAAAAAPAGSPTATALSSSSEDESSHFFYTPQGSIGSYEEGFSTPASRLTCRSRISASAGNPRSRLSSPALPPPENKTGQFPQIKSILPPSKPNSATPKVSPNPPPPPPPPMTRPPKAKTTWASSVSSRSSDSQFHTPEPKTPEENDKPSEDVEENGGGKSKLKPLHWDKVKATSDRATVWDQLKSSSFQLNEDMMESLFGCKSNDSVNKETVTKRSVLPPAEQQNRVLDPKKSQNIAILLRALNVTQDDLSEALLNGNPEALGAELLETLVKMAPTKEEEIKLKDYKGDTSKLGSAEKFLKSILDVPFAFKRVEAMLYRANFDAEINYLRKSFDTLEDASGELKNSNLFLKLLEAILRTGNRMNVGTNRGDAKAFKLDTLLKLVDIKGTDGKTTLLHFVVQEIIRSEGSVSEGLSEYEFRRQGLQIVSRLTRELGSIKIAAGMDSDVLHGYVSNLETGLEMVRIVIRLERPDMESGFFESMKAFLGRAEGEISRIKDGERKVLALVRDVTEYFHGDAAKEEAHPFRMFIIVRDFLSTLDHVCKDAGRMQDRTVVGAARSFNISTNASLPVLNRYNVSKQSLSP